MIVCRVCKKEAAPKSGLSFTTSPQLALQSQSRSCLCCADATSCRRSSSRIAVPADRHGTLIDSIQLIIDSYHHTLEVHGLPPRTDQEWLDGIGTPLRVQFAEWAHDEPQMEAMIATYRDYNIFHHDSRVTVYPGVVEMVRAVRAAGCRTGLVTSKNRVGAFRGLRLAGLDETMDVVIGADDVTIPSRTASRWTGRWRTSAPTPHRPSMSATASTTCTRAGAPVSGPPLSSGVRSGAQTSNPQPPTTGCEHPR